MWKRFVGSVVEVVEWTGVEESGGKTAGGKNGLNATVFAILTGKRWPGKVEEGRANAMEVVEWAGMGEKRVAGKSFECEQCLLF
nr:hypothetical protein [Tanacetum cinerariifolium]